MDIKFLIIIIFAFVFELFFLSKDLRFKDNPLSVKNIDIEFINSKTIEIDKNKVQNILICDKIQQVHDKKIFFKPVATLLNKNITKTIISDKATLEDKTNIITLKNNVKIIYNNKKLDTNMITYSLDNSTVLDSSNFTLKSDKIIANGTHLFFDTKNSIIKAKKIDYKIYTKE